MEFIQIIFAFILWIALIYAIARVCGFVKKSESTKFVKMAIAAIPFLAALFIAMSIGISKGIIVPIFGIAGYVIVSSIWGVKTIFSFKKENDESTSDIVYKKDKTEKRKDKKPKDEQKE